jgi:hypothetical protein
VINGYQVFAFYKTKDITLINGNTNIVGSILTYNVSQCGQYPSSYRPAKPLAALHTSLFVFVQMYWYEAICENIQLIEASILSAAIFRISASLNEGRGA